MLLFGAVHLDLVLSLRRTGTSLARVQRPVEVPVRASLMPIIEIEDFFVHKACL